MKSEMRFFKIKMWYTGTLFTPLLRYRGSAKISVVTEYNPNFPIQLVATGTILKIIIIMKKKKKRPCDCRKELEVQVAHRLHRSLYWSSSPRFDSCWLRKSFQSYTSFNSVQPSIITLTYMVLRQDSHCTLKMGYILCYFFIFVPPMYWITWGMSSFLVCCNAKCLNYLFVFFVWFFVCVWGGGGEKNSPFRVRKYCFYNPFTMCYKLWSVSWNKDQIL